MPDLIGTVLGLEGAVAYVVIAGLAYAETALLAGLVLPGEASVMLGGLLAARGNIALPAVLVVCMAAAVAGDVTGYWVGRVWFRRLLRIDWFRRIIGPRLDRATGFLDRHGASALFLARWASVVRTLTPPVAGMSEMRFARFVVGSAAGAVSWAAAFVLLGYFAGASFDSIQHFAGRASTVLIVVVAIVVVARWLTRAVIRRRERVIALWRELMDSRAVKWFVGRYGRELRWLDRRVDPHLERGLRLTVALVTLGAAAGVTGVVIEDVIAGEELALWDPTVARWFADHRTPPAASVARGALAPFDIPGVAVTLVAATGCLLWWSGWRGAVRAPVALAGAVGLCALLQALLSDRSGDHEFPATATAAAAAIAVGMSSVLGSRAGWVVGARAGGAGAAATAIVGVALLMTARSTMTGAVAGAAVGALWAAAVEVARVGARRPPPAGGASRASRRRSSRTARRSRDRRGRRRHRPTQQSGR